MYMKTLRYWISVDKYNLVKTKDIEKTVFQIAELLWKNWKISVEGQRLNFWWEDEDNKVEIKISLPSSFSKDKEKYVCEIMETLVEHVEKWDLENINIFEVDENIDRRIKKWENISELENYSYIDHSSAIEKYLIEIRKILNESLDSKQYLTTIWLMVSNVEKNEWEIKNIRNFNLPDNVSKSRLYTCSMLLKKIIKQVEDEEYYISDWITPLFYYLQSMWVSEQVKPSYDKTIQKIDALKTYFWQLENWYLSDDQIDKYNLKSLKNILVFLKKNKKLCDEFLSIPEFYSKWVKNANLLLKEFNQKIDYNVISELCDYVLKVFLVLDTKH